MTPLFDAHCHIIAPGFPLVENRGFTPDIFDVPDYRRAVSGFEVVGGAVVSGSFQGFDQTYLTHALEQLGTSFVGVAQVPLNVSDAELSRLAARGVRGIRFNLVRGSEDVREGLLHLGLRAYAVAGLHTELYVDTRELGELAPILRQLPVYSIDHLGLSHVGVPSLLELVAQGAYVKASGFGRVDFDVANVLVAIFRENPRALMFGTDLPSTRAPRPFSPNDVGLVERALGPRGAARVLRENALDFYGVRRAALTRR